jgi:diguanylate cyclase (GGDEF)-like protein
MKILIADDDFTSRAMLAGVLHKHGHVVLEAVDGAEAWRILQQPDAPRLAILDWMMPGLDGLEVVRRVRARPTERPPYMLMLTAKSKKAEIVQGLEAGADDYLAKPFDPGELRARVEVGRRLVEAQDALVESREILAHQATHDPLTGLLNRRAILEQLRKELARSSRNGDLLAVGMCDLDHFKQVNDTHGHQTGDEVLCGLAQVLEENVREYDAVGRLGGEEFLVILHMKGGTDFLAVFENLCARVADTGIATRGGQLSVTVSIGVACATPGSTVDEMLEAADAAMYRAKKLGRNRVAR